jgi:predicted glycoside hydrolase/deacetylase ChbG (UPF0249 family)
VSITASKRWLLVTADDFGIGPETSRGILELFGRGAISSTVLLVNSPYAEAAVQDWKASGQVLEVGWHPCLTLDRPILAARHVPTLVDQKGFFLPLGRFLSRIVRRQICTEEVEAEFQAQYERFEVLTGHAPCNVNAHHHIHAFVPVRDALTRVLNRQQVRPFVRSVRETWRSLVNVPGARCKRALLSGFGGHAAARQPFPSAIQLLGITHPRHVQQSGFFQKWLRSAREEIVELTCHPGFLDATLVGRDGTWTDGQIHRRVHEYEQLHQTEFLQAVHDEGFTLIRGADLMRLQERAPLAA